MQIIIGMHRAGTSLTTRLLKQAGADLGAPAGFIQPDRWNADGYFEQQEILDLNRQLLHGPWGRLTYLWLPSPRTVLRRGRRLQAQLARVGPSYRGKLVKDPRFCLTGPAWEESGTEFEKIVICLREPHEVAVSLQKRNRFPRSLGLRLWRQHYELNLRLVEGRPHWWVSYAHLLNPETCVPEVAGVARFLGLPFDPVRDAAWVKNIVRTRHDDLNGTSHAYPAALARVWDEVRARHARQSSGGN